MRRIWKLFLIAAAGCVLLLINCPAMASANYAQAINDSVGIILANVRDSIGLAGKRVAVAQFTSLDSSSECMPLSDLIEDQVVSAMNLFRRSLFVSPPSGNFGSEPFTILRVPGQDDDDILLGCDLLITGTWEKVTGGFFLTTRCVEFGEYGDYILCSVVRHVPLDGLIPAQKKCLSGPEALFPFQQGLIQDLQSELFSVERRLEALRRESDARDRKIRLTGMMNERSRILHVLKQAATSGPLPHAAGEPSNMAWLHINTVPAGLDISINDRFVGQAPLDEYPVEADVETRITVQGDPRYFDPGKHRVRLPRNSRRSVTITAPRSTGTVQFLGQIPLETVIVGTERLESFRPDRPVSSIPAGWHELILWSSERSVSYGLDLWAHDILTLDYGNLTKSSQSTGDLFLERQRLLELRKQNRELEAMVRKRLSQARRLRDFRIVHAETIDFSLGPVSSLAVSSSGRYVAVGGNGRIWLKDRKHDSSMLLQAMVGPVLSLTFSPDESRLAAGGRDNRIFFWDTASWNEPIRLSFFPRNEYANILSFSPDGAILAAGGSDGLIRVLNTDSGKFESEILVYPYSEFVNSLAFSPDGKFLASRLNEGSVKIFRIETGSLLHSFSDDREYTFPTPFVPAFSGDSRNLATTRGRDRVAIWNIEQASMSGVLGSLKQAYGVSWFPYEWCLAGWNADEMIFWDSVAMQESSRLKNLNAAFLAVPDSGYGFAVVVRGAREDVLNWWAMP
ncbi:MAG: hypothetical protein EOM25_06900 [Deltaproteobacteria bacterium]|nr:hypothetical protein [Deltaproteobacteria bacterium]